MTLVEFENIILEKEGSLTIVTINRPQALNALNSATLQELSAVFTNLAQDSETLVVVITGAGEKAFVAGADIAEMRGLNALEGREFGRLGQGVMEEIENLSQPVIAAVNGFALGGGLEIAMACDIRLAAENARFGQPEVGLGITPGFGGTQRLPRLVGAGLAKQLIFSGDPIDANEAYRIGLVNKVVPLANLLPEAKALANRIAGKAPVAVRLSKAAINEGLNMDQARGIAHEAELFGLCFATADQKEGMGAFIEKRKPVFKAR